MLKIFFISPLLLMLTACATDLGNVHIGMSKAEVIEAAGRPHAIIAANQVNDGMVEVFEYRKGNLLFGEFNNTYWLYFTNDSLERWGRPHEYLRYAN